MIRKLLYTTLFLVLYFNAQAQLKELPNQFFRHLYNMELSKSEKFIVNHMINTNDTISNNFLKINLVWWKTLLQGKSKKLNTQFYNLTNQSLKYLGNKKQKDEYDRFLELSFIGFKFRFDAINNKYISSGKTFVSYRSKLKKTLNNKKNKKSVLLKGLYNTCMSYARESSFLYKTLFLFMPSSYKNKGIKQLLKATESEDIVLSTESNYFLYKIYNELYVNKTKAIFYLERLINKYPNNIIFKIEKYKHFDYKTLKNLVKLKDDIKRKEELNTKQKQFLYSLL